MIRALVLIGCVAPAAAFAQPNFEQAPGVRAILHHMIHRHARATDGCNATTTGHPPDRHATGQNASAAIQEIVEILAADPKTDWAKVNIDALRQHLIDMNNVTLYEDSMIGTDHRLTAKRKAQSAKREARPRSCAE